MRRFALQTLCVLLFVAGCNSGPRMYPVKGKVTHKGQPVPAGVIYFDPDLSKKNDGPQGYAFIKDGAYDTTAKGGQGIIGGPYIARIRGFDGAKNVNEMPFGNPLFVEFQKPIDFPKSAQTQDFNVE